MWKKIDKIDLEPHIFKYIVTNGWVRQYGVELSKEFGLAVARQYRRWLKLASLGYSLPPISHEMDELWHTHILDTKKYAKDCEYVFGKFIHHFPYSGMLGEEDEKRHITNKKRAEKLYEELIKYEFNQK